jgi:hypothetical protein
MILRRTRDRIEGALSIGAPSLARGLIRATRPNPWRPHHVGTRTLFIHVPRTAGGALSEAFYNGQDKGHAAARHYWAHDPKQYAQFFSFAIVRNPFDRLVSAWHRVNQNAASKVTRSFAERYVLPHREFGDFVLSLRAAKQRAAIMTHPHFHPQVELLRVGNRIILDHVGRFERLADEYGTLMAHFPLAGPLGTKNGTSHTDWRTHYTPTTRAIVEDIFETDLRAFDYSYN